MRCLGIDISQASLDLALWDATRREWRLESRVPNTPEGYAQVVAASQEQEAALIVLEATGAYHVPLVSALMAAELPTSLVNPRQVKAFRQSRLGRTKTDRQDARLLAQFGATYAAELRQVAPTSPDQQRLTQLVRYRDSLVRDQIRLKNERHTNIWLAADPILVWLDERLTQLEAQLAEVEAAIVAVLAQFPEAAVLEALPGVGWRVAAATLAYLPPDLWGRPKAAASFAGVIPTLHDSGQRQRSWLSKVGPARLRRYLYLAATAAVRGDPTMAAFQAQLVERGKPKQVAHCAVMHKLLRHMMGRLQTYYAAQRPGPTPTPA